MEIKTIIYLNERDIRKIVKKHIETIGYDQVGELDIFVKSKSEIPAGAMPGDCVGIQATVKQMPASTGN